jgi:V8-like Glu-specific endopeptidase
MNELDRSWVVGTQIRLWIANRCSSVLELKNSLGIKIQHPLQISRWLFISIALSSRFAPAIAAPLTGAISDTEISRLAKESTIKITAPKIVFSGTIVYRNHNVYTVITSAANFRANPQTRFLATSIDNRVRSVAGIKFLGENLDLAMFQFSSGRDYRVAILTKKIESVKPGTTVYVSGYGYSNSTTIDPDKALFNITTGKLMINSPKPIDPTGYSLVYNNATLLGQGGGAVWNDRGEVIGIHSDGDLGNEVIASPINPDIRQIKAKRKGISIDTVRQILTKDPNFQEF